jgi:hypothetical protein
MDRKLNTFLLLFFVSLLLLHGYLLWAVRRQIVEGYPDFTSLYGAGKMVLQGQGRALYDPQEQWNTQQRFAARVKIRKGPLPYLRPPFEALLFVPFALLSYLPAYLLWGLINLALAVSIMLGIRRHVSILSQYPAWAIGLLPLAFTPVFLALLQGQDSIFLLFAYGLAYLALLKAADFKAGCFLGLGLVKPHLVVPFAIVAFLQGRKKVAVGLLSVSVVLVLISAALVGWHGLMRYPDYIWFLEHHSGRGLVLPRDTPNLRGLLDATVSGWAPHWVVLSLIGLASAAAVAWAGVMKDRPGSRDLIFCQGMIATFLVSYHAFAYDMSMMLLPALLMVAYLHQANPNCRGLTRFALLAPAIFLFVGPIYPWLWLGFHAMNLLALVLVLWMWGISREASKSTERSAIAAG